MTFYCIKRIHGHPYLYRQTNRREGHRVVSDCTYLGPAAGAVPHGFGLKSIDPANAEHARKVEEKIKRSLTIAAEQLARDKARQIAQDKKARRIRAARFRLGALEHLQWDTRLWRKL